MLYSACYIVRYGDDDDGDVNDNNSDNNGGSDNYNEHTAVDDDDDVADDDEYGGDDDDATCSSADIDGDVTVIHWVFIFPRLIDPIQTLFPCFDPRGVLLD